MGLMFMLTTIAVVIKYLTKNNTDPNMIYFALGIGGLFITRKAVSYFKPNQYYANVYGSNEIEQLSKENNILKKDEQFLQP